MAASKPVKKVSKTRRQMSLPARITEVPETPIVAPPVAPPPPPPPGDGLPETRHDIFRNLATDTARRIVKDLDLDQKLKYFSRFGSKDKRGRTDDDIVKL